MDLRFVLGILYWHARRDYSHREYKLQRDPIRETREGWPLLTVDTDVNEDSKNTNERGWFVGLVVLVQENFVLHWLL